MTNLKKRRICRNENKRQLLYKITSYLINKSIYVKTIKSSTTKKSLYVHVIDRNNANIYVIRLSNHPSKNNTFDISLNYNHIKESIKLFKKWLKTLNKGENKLCEHYV